MGTSIIMVRALGISVLSSSVGYPVACSKPPHHECGTTQPDILPLPPADKGAAPCAGRDDERARCEDTGGTWFHGLQACVCSEDEVFSAGRGCVRDDVDALVRRDAAMEKWTSAPFYDLYGLALPDRMSGARGVAAQHGSSFGHCQLKRPAQVRSSWWNTGAHTPFTIERTLATAHGGAATSMTLTINPGAPAVPLMIRTPCSDAVSPWQEQLRLGWLRLRRCRCSALR